MKTLLFEIGLWGFLIWELHQVKKELKKYNLSRLESIQNDLSTLLSRKIHIKF